MKVKELIEQLQKENQELEVMIEGRQEGTFTSIEDVSFIYFRRPGIYGNLENIPIDKYIFLKGNE